MPIYVTAVVEDDVHAAIVRRLLPLFGCKYELLDMHVKHGYTKLDKGLMDYNQAARKAAVRNAKEMYFVLRDLDALEDEKNCPQGIITDLLGEEGKADNFLFRIAVAEGENWLLADYESLYNFLEIRSQKRLVPDEITDGKEKVVTIARRSRNREYREAIVPKKGASVGYDYNGVMEEFILNHWKPEKAAENSKSLRRTIERLRAFKP